MKTAVITGITGQDGFYLASLLLSKGYVVVGIKRRTSTPHDQRLRMLKHQNLFLVSGDVTDSASIQRIVTKYQPDEFYHLAAMSHVGFSSEAPQITQDINCAGTVNTLEAIKDLKPDCRYYFAASSEMFGNQLEESSLVARAPSTIRLNELSKMEPRSPYGASKIFGFGMTKHYREAYGLFACNGILFNHESALRGENFVTRKITKSIADIVAGRSDKITLGNIDAKRDWGFAGDYCINLDVPILTINGWKYYDEISIGDIIVNFDTKMNRLSRDRVLNKVVKSSSGDKILFTGRGLHLNVTLDHRMYYQRKSTKSKGGWSDWKVMMAQELYDVLNDKSLRTKYDYRLPHFQDYYVGDSGNCSMFTDDELYLIGALLAEGSLDSRFFNGRKVSISQSFVANESILDKIIDIVDRLGLIYRKRVRNDGVYELIFDAQSSDIILSRYFDEDNVHIMPRSLYDVDSRQAAIIFGALMDCDGSWGSMSFSSKRSLLAVDFQTIAHLAGYRTTAVKQLENGMFRVGVIAKRKKYSYIQDVEKYNDSHGKVWCVTTSNQTIVTRDHGCVNISGNCRAMHMMLNHHEPDDFVIATGECYSVKDFLVKAFGCAGFDESPQELIDKYVVFDERFLRPSDIHILKGDSTKARKILGWKPKMTFNQLVLSMVQYDQEQGVEGRSGRHFVFDALGSKSFVEEGIK